MKNEVEVKRSAKRIFGSILLKFGQTLAVLAVSGAILVSYLTLPAWADSQTRVSAPQYGFYSGLNDLIANLHAPGEFMILNAGGGENIIVQTADRTSFVSLGNDNIGNNERQVLTDLGLTPAPESARANYAKINADITAYLADNNFALTYRSLSPLVAGLFGLIFLVIAALVLGLASALYGSLRRRWGERGTAESLGLFGRPIDRHFWAYRLTNLICAVMIVGVLAIIGAGIYGVSQIKTAVNDMTPTASVSELISAAQSKTIEFAILPASVSGSAPIEQYNLLALDPDGTIYHLDGLLNSKAGDHTYASLDQINNDLAPVKGLVPATGADLGKLQMANAEIVARASVWGGEAGNFASSTFSHLVVFLTIGVFLLLLIQDVAIAGPTWGVKPKKIKPVRILDDPKSASAATKKLAAAAEGLLARIADRVPQEVYDKVKLICDLALSGLEAKSAEPTIGDKAVFDLTQIITSYLPEGIDAYLSVPKHFVAKGLRGHRAPYDILMEQLALIEGNCRKLTETAVLDRTQRLETQERFLRDKTTPSSLHLE